MKIGIIGIGWVGSSVAISTLQSGIAEELLLFDKRWEVAEGEALDLAQGESFYPSAAVRAAKIEEMLDADAIVISAGRGGKPGETRLQLLSENVKIIKEIGSKLSRFKGIVVVVSNPVDILTLVLQRASGLDTARVIGTGTMLDTARLRQKLGAMLELDPRSVHAYATGEHGDSQVVLWSAAHVGGLPLRKWPSWRSENEASLAAEVRGAAQEIIKRKGATNHAIGLVTAALLRWTLRGERRILTVSRVQEGVMGIQDLALSLPTVVCAEGAVQVIEPEMDDNERQALLRSAETLKEAAKPVL